jgi:hypothetical protein
LEGCGLEKFFGNEQQILNFFIIFLPTNIKIFFGQVEICSYFKNKPMITSVLDEEKSHLTIKVNLAKISNNTEGTRIKDIAYVTITADIPQYFFKSPTKIPKPPYPTPPDKNLLIAGRPKISLPKQRILSRRQQQSRQ